MSYAKLKKLVSAPAPAFLCEGAGQKSDQRFLAHIKHELRPPASASALAKLEKMIPKGNRQLLAFYRRHNGCLLYKDRKSEAAGIELAKVSSMKSMTEELDEWLEIFGVDETDPFWSAVAIGQVPGSGNFFTMLPTGKSAGKVFYFDHDEYREEAFAASFHEFLALLTESPAKLLEELGCYARYSDGKTGIQWIPIEYFPDASVAES